MAEEICFPNFEGYDRFDYPDGLVRVTAGFGGEAILIVKYDKVALYDCGMAYCGREMTANIKRALGDRKLDYILASHSHYDHIGAMPYVLEEYPDAVVVGSKKAYSVFSRPGALELMERLGFEAAKLYSPAPEKILTDGLHIDRIVGDGDEIDLGGGTIRVLETKGHTDCTLTYALEPDSILFSSESTGCLREERRPHIVILKNFHESIASARKCIAYGARTVMVPHYGVIPEYYKVQYFEEYIKEAEHQLDLVQKWCDEGCDDEELVKRYTDIYWTKEFEEAQPFEAFLVNAKNIVKVMKKAGKDDEA